MTFGCSSSRRPDSRSRQPRAPDFFSTLPRCAFVQAMRSSGQRGRRLTWRAALAGSRFDEVQSFASVRLRERQNSIACEMDAFHAGDTGLQPMDTATAEYYRRYSLSLMDSAESSRSAMLPHIERALSAGSSVLDVGAGSGRDVAAMLHGGYDAFGVEPNEQMLATALELHPALQGRIEQAMLPNLGRPFSGRLSGGFDAVVCSAVLMHLEPAEIPHALESMVAQLRAIAIDDVQGDFPALLLSLPRLDPSRLIAQRDADGRRFHNHDAEHLRDQLSKLGLSLEWSIDSDAMSATTGTLWKSMVFRRRL